MEDKEVSKINNNLLNINILINHNINIQVIQLILLIILQYKGDYL